MTLLQSVMVICLAIITIGETRISAEREKRVISLFNVVSFAQDQCRAQESTERLGTCLTAEECSDQKGSASGNCASGFGVCCIFTLTECMGDVSQNCTNVQNPGFPSNFETGNAVAGPTCTYNIKRIEGKGAICQIRLDFQSRTTLEVDAAGTCTDPLTVTNSMTTTASAFPPTICGQLSGQHIYFDSGSTGDAGRINIVTGASNFARSWNIKVTYIECANALKAPDGCHQYFTGTSGTVSSFNHQGGSQLDQMRTRSCVRQEEGMCTIQWSPALGGTPDSFFLSDAAIAASSGAVDCTTSVVAIPDNVVVCGGILSTVIGTTIDTAISSTSPFSIRHLTTTPTAGTIGFKLCYTQMACSN